MTVFSEIPFPEEIGQNTVNLTRLQGNLFDIHGNSLSESVKVSLNKRVTKYKTKTNISGEEQETTSDASGRWSFDLPDSFNMTADSYYRITLNEKVFRKTLPDFPIQNSLGQLEDY